MGEPVAWPEGILHEEQLILVLTSTLGPQRGSIGRQCAAKTHDIPHLSY